MGVLIVESEFLEEQYHSVERALKVCLKKAQKGGSKKTHNHDSLSAMLTLSYMGFLAKAFNDNTISNIEQNENKIDALVDSVFSSFVD